MWDKCRKGEKKLLFIPVEETSIVVAAELTTENPRRKEDSKKYR
jgi:hypothetical protein